MQGLNHARSDHTICGMRKLSNDRKLEWYHLLWSPRKHNSSNRFHQLTIININIIFIKLRIITLDRSRTVRAVCNMGIYLNFKTISSGIHDSNGVCMAKCINLWFDPSILNINFLIIILASVISSFCEKLKLIVALWP